MINLRDRRHFNSMLLNLLDTGYAAAYMMDLKLNTKAASVSI